MAEGRPVRDDVLVYERLEVGERHLEVLHGHGQDGDGDGEVALAAGEHVLEGRLLEAVEADMRQGLAGELRAVAGVVPRDGRGGLPQLVDGNGRGGGWVWLMVCPLRARVRVGSSFPRTGGQRGKRDPRSAPVCGRGAARAGDGASGDGRRR